MINVNNIKSGTELEFFLNNFNEFYNDYKNERFWNTHYLGSYKNQFEFLFNN